MELLRELVPTAGTIAVLVNPNSPGAEGRLRDVREAAGLLGQQFSIVNASSEGDFEVAFANVVQQRAGALIVVSDPFFTSSRDQLTALAAGRKIPAIYHDREFAAAGGLMSYGASLAGAYQGKDVQAAGSAVGRQIEILAASTARDIDAAFVSFAKKRADALVVSPDPLLDNRRLQIVTLAAHQRLPAIYSFRENVDIGGLMSYGSSAGDRDRQAAVYAGRILKGEAPGSLPVMRAAKFEFVFNLQTARALGLDVPATLLAQADEVIE